MAMNQMTYHQPNQYGGAPPAPVAKPPRKNPYRDGISSSHQSYDLFEEIRHPNKARHHRPPISPANMGKPLTKQKRLEKAIYEKFKRNNFELPGVFFKLIGKFFKAIFLLLMFPLYMIAYRFPKWLLMETLPRTIKIANDYCTAFEKRVINSSKRFFWKMVDPFILFWKMLRSLSKRNKTSQQVVDEYGTGFFAFIAMGIWFMIKPLYRSILWSYNAMKRSYQYIKSLPKKVLKTTRSIQECYHQSMAFVEKGFAKIRKSFLEFFTLQGLKSKYRTVSFFIQSLRMQAYQFFGRHYKKACSYFKSRVTALKKHWEGFRSRFVDRTEAIGRFLYDPIKRTIDKISRVHKTFSAKTNKRLERCHHFVMRIIVKPLERVWSTLVAYIAPRGAELLNVISRWKVIAYEYLQMKVQFLISYLKPNETVFHKTSLIGRTLLKWIKDRSQLLRHQITKKFSKLKPILNLIVELSQFLKRGVIYFSKKIQMPLQPIQSSLHHVFSHLFLRLRIIAAWVSVLCRHGLTVLGQTAQELGWF